MPPRRIRRDPQGSLLAQAVVNGHAQRGFAVIKKNPSVHHSPGPENMKNLQPGLLICKFAGSIVTWRAVLSGAPKLSRFSSFRIEPRLSIYPASTILRAISDRHCCRNARLAEVWIAALK